MNINKEIDVAISELTQATERLSLAAQRQRDASKDETNAVNVVNAAQKKLDALYATLRKTAPRSTDWGRPNQDWSPAG
jgi:hypothetical protein